VGHRTVRTLLDDLEVKNMFIESGNPVESRYLRKLQYENYFDRDLLPPFGKPSRGGLLLSLCLSRSLGFILLVRVGKSKIVAACRVPDPPFPDVLEYRLPVQFGSYFNINMWLPVFEVLKRNLLILLYVIILENLPDKTLGSKGGNK